MKINRNNYEAYFLDYHEGTLDAGQVAELMLFLERNPQLKEEFESFEEITLEPAGVVFSGKEELKKGENNKIGSGNYEEYFINSIENNLSGAEQQELQSFLQANPSLNAEYELYRKTILPAEKIVFTGKAALKRGTKVRPLYYYVAAAASVLLAIGLYMLLQNDRSGDEQPFAGNDAKKEEVQKENLAANNILPPADSVPLVKKNDAMVSNRLPLENKKKENKVLAADTNDRTVPVMKEVFIVKEEKQPEKKMDMPKDSVEAPVFVNNSKTPSPEVKNEEKYISVKEYAALKLKEKVLGEPVAQQAPEKKESGLWSVAKAAAKGFQKLTGRESDVKPQYNDKGELTGYVVSAGAFELARSNGK